MHTIARRKTQDSNCHLQHSGIRLLTGSAGWLTALHQDCLAHSINYALQIVQDQGTIVKEYIQWLQEAQCAATAAPARRGRLRLEGGQQMVPVDQIARAGGLRRKGGGGAAGGGMGGKQHTRPSDCP